MLGPSQSDGRLIGSAADRDGDPGELTGGRHGCRASRLGGLDLAASRLAAKRFGSQGSNICAGVAASGWLRWPLWGRCATSLLWGWAQPYRSAYVILVLNFCLFSYVSMFLLVHDQENGILSI